MAFHTITIFNSFNQTNERVIMLVLLGVTYKDKTFKNHKLLFGNANSICREYFFKES